MPKIELIQGDCLEKMKDIPDWSIDCIITDPPYGTTTCKWDPAIPFEPMWEQLKRVIKKNGAICLFGSQPFTSALVMSKPKMFNKHEWVWEENHAAGQTDIKNISVFYEKLPTYNSQGVTEINKKCAIKRDKETTIYNDVGLKEGEYTQKYPPNLIIKTMITEYLIKTYTNEGETILDFTMGSGTTGVACKNLNRGFIGIEPNPEHFKIAEKRIRGE